jgi:hypothetical protein
MVAVAWAAIGLLAATLVSSLFYLGSKIDGLGSSLSGRIDSLDDRLSGRLDALSSRIDTLDARLSGRLDALPAWTLTWNGTPGR